MSTTDRLAARGLMLLAAAAVLVGGVGARLYAWVAAEPLRVSAVSEQDGPLTGEALREGATAVWGDRVVYVIPRPTTAQRVGDLLPSAVLLLLLVAGVALLWRLLDRAASDDPFLGEPTRAIHVLAILVSLGAVVLPMVGMLGRLLTVFPVQEHPAVYFRATPEEVGMALGGCAAAGLIEALGQLFRHGARLRADTDGLV